MKYKEALSEFIKANKIVSENSSFLEFKFEAMRDWCLKGSIDDVKKWYYSHVEQTTMKLNKISLMDCEGWSFSQQDGSIQHSSGEFFKVEAYRVTGTDSREVKKGWDQPFLTQVGFDGGILGLLRKRFDGIPHYLVEAKEEPGNYNIVQISPTVQATFSNLKRAHKGDNTNYSELFLYPEKHPVNIILNQWMSEDGGRLFNKRNKSMLIEYAEDKNLNLVSDRYRWVSLYQLKELIKTENAIVAPHIRGILSAL